MLMTFTYIYSLRVCGIEDGGMKLLSKCMEKMVNLQELEYVDLQKLHSTLIFVNIYGCPT